MYVFSQANFDNAKIQKAPVSATAPLGFHPSETVMVSRARLMIVLGVWGDG